MKLLLPPNNTNTNNGDDSIISKAQRDELIRTALPDCQPQEGSPANSFTPSEMKQLQTVVKEINLGPRARNEEQFLLAKKKNNDDDYDDTTTKKQFPPSQKMDILNPNQWSEPNNNNNNNNQDSTTTTTTSLQQQQHHTTTNNSSSSTSSPPLVWHGAPVIHHHNNTTMTMTPAQLFRLTKVRNGEFTSPTNGQCPGYMQCNLVVLPSGPIAFDFLLFCQRNKQSCPLIEVCDVGSPHPVGVARGADLRTDIPKYSIYKNGVLEKEVTSVTDCWPVDSVAFLIGCSFTYDGAFIQAGLPLRSAEQGRNVPMYRTNLPCRPSGQLKGTMVVSMKPIPAMMIAKEVEITSKYPHAHGGPICVGNAQAIGIADLNQPDWGDAIEIRDDEIPVFHACGVTPQSILMDSQVPFAITHSPGHMFITDLPCDTVI
mmetsp:Transcript_23817/g.36043  ORF Transcript_23817/g.36043 Transcript_23817/m.36043 type:complete len:428 (-) Transcript_23817:218-1501(-)